MEWTKEQQQIINLRNSNILVSAAAGSGKTAVLVERIINLVKYEKEDIDKFLIVTFTNAAAAGMKQKIQKALVKAISQNEGDTFHLRRQLNLLNRAQISTIHSFCIDVVRKNFHIIGIDPNFRIGDTNETEIILQESIDEVLERAYKLKSDDFVKLVESFTKNRGDKELSDLMKDMYRFIMSFPNPIEFLKKSVEMLNLTEDELSASLWVSAIKQNADMLISGASEALTVAIELCNDPDGPNVYLEALNEDTENCSSLKKKIWTDFQSFIKAIHVIQHPKLKALRGKNKEDCNESKQSEVKILRDEYKKIIDTLAKLIPNKTWAQFTQDINYMHGSMFALYELIEDLSETFRNKKTEKGIADFNDAEHYALEILSHPEIGHMYREKFKYIFIDEYQDSNRIQESLTEKIKRDNNVFMVGDVKQSIYRFRLADPGLFMEKYDEYENQVEDHGRNVRVDLMKNFRSRAEILNGTNYIFKNIMCREMGEIDYDQSSFLNVGTEFKSCSDNFIELNIINKNTDDDDDDDMINEELKTMRTAEIEAKFMAQRIKDLLNEFTYVPDKDSFQKIEYKDIVILMRAVSNWSEVFEEIFETEGIPLYSDVGKGYFETIEIQVMINLLKIIDNIRQDIPLLSILRSPIGRFTTEELINIRVFSPRLSYIEALYAYKNKGNNLLAEKIRDFVNTVEGWKKRSRYTKLNDLIWEILMETGYYYFAGVLPKGNLRQANLRLLADKAYDFEKTSMRGLFNFMRFVEKLSISSGDVATAKTLGENDNVVRLMSVHKSKGLEFPVVIMCGMNKKFNRKDTTQNILKHKDYGLAPKYINHEERIYRETLPRLSLKNIVKTENLSEEMRVLYVAMTRAVDKLILIGTVADMSPKIKRWKKGTSKYNIYSSESFLDWLCSSLYKHIDSKVLRDISLDEDIPIDMDDLSSKWKINIVNLRDISEEQIEKSDDRKSRIAQIKDFKYNEDSPYYKEISRRLSWEYGHQRSVNIPSKLSVTDMKSLSDKNIEYIKYIIPALKDIPLFKEQKTDFTKAEIGTIVHFVMQHLNLKQSLTYDNIVDQVTEMTNKNLLTDKEVSVVDIDKILEFFSSDIGIRMIKSPLVKREVPFIIKKKAKDIIKTGSEDDVILMQGIIDCYFDEAGENVIIDYKTDDVSNTSVEILKERYKPQILSYKEAVEKITGKHVKGCYLYLFDEGKAVEIK